MALNKDTISAVILAGGKGRRLGGQDKGLVNYKGKLLIEHVLQKITPQVGKVLINANRNREAYKKFGYRVISDDLSDFQGPLAGFAAGIKAANSDYIMTLPCDGPHIPEDLVSRMCEVLNTTTADDQTLVVAHDGERMQPVYALIPVNRINSLENFLQTGDRKIDRWYAQENTLLADFSDKPEVFFNINTEEQRSQD